MEQNGIRVEMCFGSNQENFLVTQIHHKWKYRKKF